MDQALARFAQYLKCRFGQSSTPVHYLSDLKIFLAAIGDRLPETVLPADVDHFVENQIAADLRPTTINRRLSSIRSFFEFLASENPEALWPNPISRRRHTLRTTATLPRDVSDDDVARLFATISDDRDRAMFGLMVGTGLTVSEVVALRQEHLAEPVEAGAMARLTVCGRGRSERIVWLSASLYELLQAWLRVRPVADTDYLFLNHRGHPIKVNGIQHRLAQHCRTVGIKVSCRQLRHTFGRRMAENGLPAESLAQLLGHRCIQSSQRYIDATDPTTRNDFTSTMALLERNLLHDAEPPTPFPTAQVHPGPRTAPAASILKLRHRLHPLPDWLATGVDTYLSWRWPTWGAQTAYKNGANLVSLVRRIWIWLQTHRQVDGWESFQRADLAAWLIARRQDDVSDVTVRNDLAQFRSLLRFLDARGYPLDQGLFRIRVPRRDDYSLPRNLSEAEYGWLETNILQATEKDSYDAHFDRAWFFCLSHTGMRLSELLDLRLEDLNLGKGTATIRGGKSGRDRNAYLTPRLAGVLRRYLSRRPDAPGDDCVFLLHGRPPSARTIQRRLARYGQQVGVKASPHLLRHTLASRLLNAGMPIRSLQKVLGHKHLDTTQIYARISDDMLYEQFREAKQGLEKRGCAG